MTAVASYRLVDSSATAAEAVAIRRAHDIYLLDMQHRTALLGWVAAIPVKEDDDGATKVPYATGGELALPHVELDPGARATRVMRRLITDSG